MNHRAPKTKIVPRTVDIVVEDRRFVAGREFDLVSFQALTESGREELERYSHLRWSEWSPRTQLFGPVLGVPRKWAPAVADMLTDALLNLEYGDLRVIANKPNED